MRTIHQFHPSLGYGDAVSNDCFELQRLFWDWGAESELYAWDRKPNVRAFAKDYREHPAFGGGHPDRLLLVHLSMGNPSLDEVRDLPDTKVVRYHNIAPARFFAGSNEHARIYAERGREQLRELAKASPLGIGDSDFNRRELEEAGFAHTATVPILIDWSWADARPDPAVAARIARDGSNAILFVGRTSRQKAVGDLIAGFARYREHDPDACLYIVGWRADDRPYAAELDAQARALGVAGAVIFTGSVTDAELVAYYRGASAFATMSDHEGFCVPLLEAMRFGTPIVAHAAGAIPETLGDAGILIERKTPDEIAAALKRAVADRESLAERGRRRLEDFSRERVERALREALASAGIEAPALRRQRITLLSSSERSGITTYSQALAGGLRANGHTVDYAGVRHWDGRDLSRAVGAIPRETDLVLIEHEFGIFKNSALIRAMARLWLRRKKIVLSLHELEPEKFHHFLKVIAAMHYRQGGSPLRDLVRVFWHTWHLAQRFVRYRLTLWLLGVFVTRAIAHSERTLMYAPLVVAPDRKIGFVPHLIVPPDAPPPPDTDLDMLKRELRERLGLPQDRFIFVSPGFLFRRKRLVEVIAAAPDDALVVLSGTESAYDHSYLAEIERYIAANGKTNVVINTDYEKMQDHVFASDAVVLFYKEVFQSGIATHAMWAEKPTIFSRLRSFEMFEEAGLFVADEAELARAMREIRVPAVYARLRTQTRLLKRLLSAERIAPRYLAGMGE